LRDKLVFVGLAWLAAYVIVMVLLLVFGDRMLELPLALRSLVVSGVLVISMTQLVIPMINAHLRRAASRRTGADTPTGLER